MRRAVLAALILAALALAAGQDARAQWCADYQNGTKECGIPTEDSCRQSVSGVGGICEPESPSEAQAPARKPFPILRELFQPPGANLPGSDPSDMPPPPVR
jgi:hypothetical protein